ncbi:hypothetical protein WJX79_009212 [Trebouxia sp. C0005]
MVAANLFTEENFAYYDLMLDTIQQHYHEGTGRRLVCFFLDIACQLNSYWNRHHPGETESHTAIGPWHARVHKTACQRQFGARQDGLSALVSAQGLQAATRQERQDALA